MKSASVIRPLSLLVAAFGLLALTSCSAPSLPSDTSPVTNWAGYYANTPGSSLQISSFTSSLQFTETTSGTTATGNITLVPQSTLSGCMTAPTTVSVSGTTDSAFDLILNFSVGGGTGTITTALASGNSLSTAPANVAITGGTCAQNLSGYVMRPTPFVDGTYTGTLTASNNSTVNVSVTMIEDPIPDVTSGFTVTGNMSLSGSGCSTLIPIAGGTNNGAPFTITGSTLSSIGTVTPGAPNAQSVASSLTFASLNAGCSAGNLSGTLNYVPGT